MKLKEPTETFEKTLVSMVYAELLRVLICILINHYDLFKVNNFDL